MRRLAPQHLVVLCLVLACENAAGPATPTTDPMDLSVPLGVPARQVVVCLTGAVDQQSGSNAGLSRLCDALGSVATVVPSCEAGRCWSSFATFTRTEPIRPISDATLAALDLTADGRVDAADGPTTLTLVGFSWGGVTGADLSRALSSDKRIDHAFLTLRLVALDGFQPFVPDVKAAAEVDEAFSFRHSVTPASDCSTIAPLGPYLGLPLRCAQGQRCADFDFSAAPSARFNGLRGSTVGHCDVPEAAAPWVTSLVKTGKLVAPLPPTVPVLR
ncbi:MAG: hypothetical protein IAE78_17335 [Myxococcus sp.]|nr:hypothetical protein [Myxococcus sp.]